MCNEVFWCWGLGIQGFRDSGFRDLGYGDSGMRVWGMEGLGFREKPEGRGI